MEDVNEWYSHWSFLCYIPDFLWRLLHLPLLPSSGRSAALSAIRRVEESQSWHHAVALFHGLTRLIKGKSDYIFEATNDFSAKQDWCNNFCHMTGTYKAKTSENTKSKITITEHSHISETAKNLRLLKMAWALSPFIQISQLNLLSQVRLWKKKR